MNEQQVKCGDCRYFVRDGKCSYFFTPEGSRKDRPFSEAPFWVWSDCYSDREQVRRDVTSRCAVFANKQAAAVAGEEQVRAVSGEPAP